MSKCANCNKWFLTGQKKVPSVGGRNAHDFNCVSSTNVNNSPGVSQVPRFIPNDNTDESVVIRTARQSLDLQVSTSPRQSVNQHQSSPETVSVSNITPLTTPPPSCSVSFKKLKQEVECSICYDIMETAQTLTPCMHSFCSGCTKTLGGSGLNHQFSQSNMNIKACPLCRKKVEKVYRNIQMENISRLVIALALNHREPAVPISTTPTGVSNASNMNPLFADGNSTSNFIFQLGASVPSNSGTNASSAHMSPAAVAVANFSAHSSARSAAWQRRSRQAYGRSSVETPTTRLSPGNSIIQPPSISSTMERLPVTPVAFPVRPVLSSGHGAYIMETAMSQSPAFTFVPPAGINPNAERVPLWLGPSA